MSLPATNFIINMLLLLLLCLCFFNYIANITQLLRGTPSNADQMSNMELQEVQV
uniref:Uncharacterized protein n=1 Tax=Cajanus cajan TaxID=3821 RepID=A0A151UA62_CAJCA|nr:hypothetical protein KK1_020449 [Cajanus cajan]